MARPSHLAQQRVVDDALAALPSSKWRWLFTPDPRWLAAVNPSTLREVNAVRMFVATTVLFLALELGVVAFALTRCGVQFFLFGWRIIQMLPPSGKLSFDQWQKCENSFALEKMFNFADGLFNTYGILLGVMAGVAVAGNILKRVTDTEHKVQVEQAKKAPVIINPPTGEHPAQQAPAAEVNVNVHPTEKAEGEV